MINGKIKEQYDFRGEEYLRVVSISPKEKKKKLNGERDEEEFGSKGILKFLLPNIHLTKNITKQNREYTKNANSIIIRWRFNKKKKTHAMEEDW